MGAPPSESPFPLLVQVEVGARLLLLHVLHAELLVDARAVVGGVATEGDLQLLQRQGEGRNKKKGSLMKGERASVMRSYRSYHHSVKQRRQARTFRNWFMPLSRLWGLLAVASTPGSPSYTITRSAR